MAVLIVIGMPLVAGIIFAIWLFATEPKNKKTPLVAQ